MTTESPRRWTRGNTYEDFEIGGVFEHHWGRTLNEGDNSIFGSLTLAYNPLYFNAAYAQSLGHPALQINPVLVFLTAFGMSVEDLSEAGGLFLGVEELTYHLPVYPGDTITARSTVVGKRESDSRPDSGIVTWHTEGFNQRGERVIDFKRTNFVARRGISPVRG
jgi:itaconyl-CoA hydratase